MSAALIQFGTPMPEYRKSSGVNVSALKEMALSPAHYLQNMQEPNQAPNDAQIIGTITHSAILEQDFDGFVIRPDGMKFNTKEGKAWRDTQTKPVIDQEDAANIAGMVQSVKAHPMAAKLLYGTGNNEVVARRIHPGTGLELKGRADRVAVDASERTVVIDLKTCGRGDGGPLSFAREARKWQYDVQAAFYMDLFEASFFCFVVVEKEAPYAVACYCLDAESIQTGRTKYNGYLERLAKCIAENHFPAYGDDLASLTIKPWKD